MKKFIFSIFALLLAVLLVACGSKTYTVTFNSNGGSAVASQEVESGKFATKPATNPTKAQNTFGGWFENADLSGSEFKFTETKITADITLYAKWTPVVTPTRTYAADGKYLGYEIKGTDLTTVEVPLLMKIMLIDVREHQKRKVKALLHGMLKLKKNLAMNMV